MKKLNKDASNKCENERIFLNLLEVLFFEKCLSRLTD